MLGTSSAAQLARLGKSLFGAYRQSPTGIAGWLDLSRDEAFLSSIDQAIEVLRAPQSTTAERLDAAAAIRLDGSGHAPWSWHQIENTLIAYQLGWPLFVAAVSAGQAGIGLSLPVSVDIDFDGLAKVAVPAGSGILDLDAWRSSLKRCAEVGRQLWRSKRGNCGEFRDVVARSSVHFDFSIAQEIGSDLAKIGFRIPVDGGSADAYFAQLVLS